VRATSTRALACWKVWQMSSALVLRPILTGPLRASGESNVWARDEGTGSAADMNKGTGRNKKGSHHMI